MAGKRTRLAIGMLTGLVGAAGQAHSPHDVIDSFAVVAPASGPSTLYAVIAGNFLVRSVDEGASWQDMNAGLDNRFAFTSVAARIRDGVTTVLAATNGDGVYRSEDGGNHWTPSNRGLPQMRLHDVALDRSGDLAIATGAEGKLFLSENAGRDWRAVNSMDDQVSRARLCNGSKSTVLVAGTSSGAIRWSEDRGKIWSTAATMAEAGSITGVSCDLTSNGGELLIGTRRDGVHLLNLAGDVHRISTGLPELDVQDVAVVRRAGEATPIFLASTWREGVVISHDRGATWQPHSEGLTSDSQADSDPAHRSPHFRRLAAVESEEDGELRLYVGAFTGLFTKTLDDGDWTELESISVKRIIDTAAAPTADGQFLVGFTTYGGGAYLIREPDQHVDVLNHGLTNPRLTDIVFPPGYPEDNRIFTAVHGSLLTWDVSAHRWLPASLRAGGLSEFKRRALGFLHHRAGLPASVTTDFLTEEDRSVPYPEAIATAPDLGTDPTLFLTTRRDGLISYDLRADRVTRLLPSDRLVRDVLVDPRYPAVPHLFSAVQAEGVYKSSDGGSTWHPANRGLAAVNTWRNLMEEGWKREADQLPYFAIRLFQAGGSDESPTLFAATGPGLFRSVDAAETWSRLDVAADIEREIVLSAGVSPDFARDRTVLASLKGHGLYRSRDGGASFEPFAESLRADSVAIAHLEFSPHFAEDRTIYAGSEQNLYSSRDEGDTWHVVPRFIRYENERDVIRYTGAWDREEASEASGTGLHVTRSPGAAASLRFVGTGIRVVGSSGTDAVELVLDGQIVPAPDGSGAENGNVLAFIDGLDYGPHSLTVRFAPRNGSASRELAIDAFDALGVHFQDYNRPQGSRNQ